MEFETVKEWLDRQIKKFKESTGTDYLTQDIYADVNTSTNILFYKGLDIVADVMGLEIKEKFVQNETPDTSYFKYSFIYEGVEFVTYPEERLSRFARTD